MNEHAVIDIWNNIGSYRKNDNIAKTVYTFFAWYIIKTDFYTLWIFKIFQIFVLNIICLFTLLVIRTITPIPIVMETWKRKGKCFLSDPVIHEPPNLPYVSTRYPIHTSLLSADHPRISRPPNNRQAQGHYVTDE